MNFDENTLYNIKTSLPGMRRPLFDLAIWKNGLAFKKINFSEEGVPVIKIAELNNGISSNTSFTKGDYGEEVRLHRGDLLFSWSGNPQTSIDVYKYQLYDGWLNQHIFKVTANETMVSKDFLFYLLKYLKPHFTQIATNKQTTGLGHVTIADLKRMSIVVPEKKVQEGIVAIVKTIDDKIEVNNDINKNLEEQIQVLCRSWLIDYAPFGYKRPDTWSVVPLSSIADFVSGYSYKGAELIESDIAMATIKNFDRKGGFKLDGYKEIQPSAKLKPEQHAELFDTLVAHTDLTQNAEVIGNAEPVLSLSGYRDIVFSMDVVKVLPKDGISKFLLAALLQSGRFKAHALGYVNGTTVLHLSKKALPEFELPLPSNLDELAPLANAAEAMYRQIANNIDESTKLAKLRDSLLPQLMSGELDVSDLDL
ncbi:restriction endonuclease subunit S [Criibacterium bergeronii]|nr:restriction endonuclease subunit S [Criibacterium bergeronii]